ncbi:MAG: hypothetical protein JW750_10945 [Anaerolineaceae bacterium]|nr:hypothetical protein [Anaerolineaceae bacterium]
MMRPFLYRLAGFLLFLCALVGLAISVFAIWGAWKIKPSAENFLVEATQLVVDSIDLSDGMLAEVENTLTVIDQSLASINDVKDNLVSAVESALPVIEMTSDFVGEDLVTVMDNLQSSLDMLGGGMEKVESALSFLNNLPLIGEVYQGYGNTMSGGVSSMSEQVDAMSLQFEGFQVDLENASQNLQEIHGDVAQFTGQMEEMELTLKHQIELVDGYQLQLASMRQKVLDFRARGLKVILWTVIGLTVVCAWMGVLEIVLILLGIENLIHGDKKRREREQAQLRATLETMLEEGLKEELLRELRLETGVIAPAVGSERQE